MHMLLDERPRLEYLTNSELKLLPSMTFLKLQGLHLRIMIIEY